MAIIAHNTLRHGATAGLPTAIGVGLGEVCLLGAIFAGLSLSGELLPALFRWLSLAGALYLIWLAAAALPLFNRPSRSPDLSRARTPVLGGLTMAFASPSALLFYAAFFPQFMDPDHSISRQMVLLSAMYVCMRSLSASACVFTVARLRLPPRPFTGRQIFKSGQCRSLSLDRSRHRPQTHGGFRLICEERSSGVALLARFNERLQAVEENRSPQLLRCAHRSLSFRS